MILTVTGTRTYITRDQFEWMWGVLGSGDVDELHHGACTGADERSHQLALREDVPAIFVHPPIDGKYMMEPDWNHDTVFLLPHKDYHQRDRDMVNRSHQLLALPNTARRPHSGTWYTITYADEIRHIPITIVYPNGKVVPLNNGRQRPKNWFKP